MRIIVHIGVDCLLQTVSRDNLHKCFCMAELLLTNTVKEKSIDNTTTLIYNSVLNDVVYKCIR